jgi:hypothetical protein
MTDILWKWDNNDKFPFGKEMVLRFEKWTGIKNPDISEALRDLTADTYWEMRKLEAVCLSEIERLILEDKYPGYLNGVELTLEQKNLLKEKSDAVKEDLKEFFRKTLYKRWCALLTRQKIGVDKLGIAIKPYISYNNGQEDQKDKIRASSEE